MAEGCSRTLGPWGWDQKAGHSDSGEDSEANSGEGSDVNSDVSSSESSRGELVERDGCSRGELVEGEGCSVAAELSSRPIRPSRSTEEGDLFHPSRNG